MQPTTENILLPVLTAVPGGIVLGKSKAIAGRQKRPLEVRRWKATKLDMRS
jgi:hypothetical protein